MLRYYKSNIQSIKKFIALLLRKFATFLGFLLGVFFRFLLTRNAKCTVSRIGSFIIKVTPKKFYFITFSFFWALTTEMLLGESDGLFVLKKVPPNTLMNLDITQCTQRQIYLHHIFGPHIYNYLVQKLRKGDTFIDIGANVGIYSLLAAQLVGETGAVYSFEPEHSNYEKLISNISLNKLQNIYTFNIAVSDRSGVATLFLHPQNEGGHSLSTEESESDVRQTQKVPSIIFDDWVTDTILNNTKLIKIDVEGFELSVLNGMYKTLKNTDNIEVICEVSKNLLAVYNYMKSMGYDAYDLSIDGIPTKVLEITHITKREFLFSKRVKFF